MSIVFLEDEKLFHLFNENFSVFLQIHESGTVLCPYFGKHLTELDATATNAASLDWYSAYFSVQQGAETTHENLWMNSSPFFAPTDKCLDPRPSMISVE